MESLWVHSPQFATRTKQFLVTPDTPLFVSAANQKVNMSDWRRMRSIRWQGGQNFIVRTAWFLQGDRTLRNQTGSPRRLGTSDSGSRMISSTMQAGERVSRYEADRSVMENTDPKRSAGDRKGFHGMFTGKTKSRHRGLVSLELSEGKRQSPPVKQR